MPNPVLKQSTIFYQVHQLDWFCRSCGPATSSPSSPSVVTRSNLDSSVRLASLNSEGSSLSSDRLALTPDNFSLVVAPSRASDSGDYFCLVNGKAEPSLVTRLVVQSKFKKHNLV